MRTTPRRSRGHLPAITLGSWGNGCFQRGRPEAWHGFRIPDATKSPATIRKARTRLGRGISPLGRGREKGDGKVADAGAEEGLGVPEIPRVELPAGAAQFIAALLLVGTSLANELAEAAGVLAVESSGDGGA